MKRMSKEDLMKDIQALESELEKYRMLGTVDVIAQKLRNGEEAINTLAMIEKLLA